MKDFKHGILMQVMKIVDFKKIDRNTKYLNNINKTVLDFILSAGWKKLAKITSTTDN